MSTDHDRARTPMNAESDLQISTNAAGRRTYTRADLGITTAVVVLGPSGVEARLYYGPEADEYDAVPAEMPDEADRVAVGHSCTF
jgi:hypothetical protein